MKPLPNNPLSDERRTTFAAAADRILPGECGPGATAANVAGSLGLLCRQELQQSRQRLENALDLLQSMAREAHGRDFARCSAAERDELLGRMQRIPHAAIQRSFRTLVSMTLLGFLCDPVHGGNRDGVGWHFLGVWFNRLEWPS